MKETKMVLLKKSEEVAEDIVSNFDMDACFVNNEVRLWLKDDDGYVKLADEVNTKLPLGLTPEEVESYLSLNGAHNAVYRALAAKAGIGVRTADWFYFNN